MDRSSEFFTEDYIEDFAVQHAVNPEVSFYSVAVIGIAGVLGRIVMGLAAERVGPWNLVVLMTGLSFLTTCLVMALYVYSSSFRVRVFASDQGEIR